MSIKYRVNKKIVLSFCLALIFFFVLHDTYTVQTPAKR